MGETDDKEKYPEFAALVEEFTVEAAETAPPEAEILALARVNPDALDAEALRVAAVANAHRLTRQEAEQFQALVLETPYGTYRCRVALLQPLSVTDKRRLSRRLEIFSLAAIKFVVLEAHLFDFLLREAYEPRNLIKVATRKGQDQTRRERVWGGGAAPPPLSPGVRNDAPAERRAGERLDLSDLAPYHRMLEEMGSGEFDENEVDPFTFVEFLLQDFVQSGGSDLHLHSARGFCRIRYRFQGEVYTRFSGIPLPRFKALISCLCNLANKEASRMNREVVESVIKLRINLEGAVSDVEFRFESLPTLHCPSVNLRGQTKPLRDIKRIGLTPEQLGHIAEALSHDRGIVVVTGPTGSGKTNTLNTIFAQLEEDDSRVILEFGSPIEIESPRRVQITIRDAGSEKLTDLLYQQMFKAAMRFDPDVIAFTEIRNADEARIAFRAANTGHLVFTTMHAADVEETFGRLFEMGLDRSIVAKGILAIVAQTLIRKLCEGCKIEDAEASEMAGVAIYRENEAGCDCCDGGYAGRTAVAEVLLFNDDVRQMIGEGHQPAHIVARSVERGYLTPMKQVALGKLHQGVTSETEAIQLVQLRTEVNAEAESEVVSGAVWHDTFNLPVQDADFTDVEEVVI